MSDPIIVKGVGDCFRANGNKVLELGFFKGKDKPYYLCHGIVT
ncbi:unnamed protein product, partial [marine sediment metagenome]